VRSFLPFTLILFSVISAACGGGGAGEPQPTPNSSFLGDGNRIADLTDPANPRPNPNAALRVTGARVTFVDTFDETRDGRSQGNVYVQDLSNEPIPYQGILVFGATYSPPSFRPSRGDVVDLNGQYQDFVISGSDPTQPLPELVNATVSFRFDSPLTPTTPKLITIKDLVSYDTGRQWLSMLVTIENVKSILAQSEDSAGRVTISLSPEVGGIPQNRLPQITNELFDLKGAGFDIQANTQIQSVTGLVTYFFGRFRIAPRSVDDIKL
jgi:hypothetical protein